MGFYSPAIQWVTILFMFLAGVNFTLHYRTFTGHPREMFRNAEWQWYLASVLGVSAICFGALVVSEGSVSLELLRRASFSVVSVHSTTGFGTSDFAAWPLVGQVLLLGLMFVGSMGGSTGGGFKVVRVAILTKLIGNRLYRLNASRLTRTPLTVDKHIVEDEEIKRISAIFFMWMLLLLVGGGITAFFSDLTGWQSFSGMFSALGNIGPCYISVEQMIGLHPVVKLTYMIGMLAGRLEIIPVLIIFTKRFFK